MQLTWKKMNRFVSCMMSWNFFQYFFPEILEILIQFSIEIKKKTFFATVEKENAVMVTKKRKKSV